MSQHIFNTTDLNNASVKVVVGYDNQTAEYFFQVHRNGEVEESSLAMPDVTFDSVGLLQSVNRLGIVVPVPLVNQLALEGMFGAPNDAKEWPDHEKSETEKALLTLGMIQNMASYLPQPTKAQWVLVGLDSDDYSIHCDQIHEVYTPRRMLTTDQAHRGPLISAEELLAMLTSDTLMKEAKIKP